MGRVTLSRLFILAFVLSWLFISTVAAVPAFSNLQPLHICYEPVSPLPGSQYQPVSCPPSNSSSLIATAASIKPIDHPQFSITLFCDTPRTDICDSANSTLAIAEGFFNDILQLTQSITVNATLTDFCEQQGMCTDDGYEVLGGAAPARMFVMTDEDGMSRTFAQALVKQLSLSEHSEYAPYDISAMFNTENNWWFQSNTNIQPTQHDFLFVLCHELVHGLGFTSSWDDYLHATPEALTPNPLNPSIILSSDSSGQSTNSQDQQFTFTGFFETSFDRFLVQLPSLTPLTQITNQLNAFDNATDLSPLQQISQTGDMPIGMMDMVSGQLSASGEVLKVYSSQQEFIDHFQASPVYRSAQLLLMLATQNHSIGFMPSGGSTLSDVIYLETGLQPFTTGSSIMHLEYTSYATSPDFLMVFMQQPGITLTQCISHAGKGTMGPFGPRLLTLLSTMGYNVKNDIGMLMGASSATKRAALGIGGKGGGVAWGMVQPMFVLSLCWWGWEWLSGSHGYG